MILILTYHSLYMSLHGKKRAAKDKNINVLHGRILAFSLLRKKNVVE